MRRVARERALEHLEEPRGQRGPRLAERVDAAVADRQEHRELAAPGEERLPEEHLGEHDGRREEVGAMVERLAGDLLGREVGELALEHRAAAAMRSVARLVERAMPKSPSFTPSVGRQVDVRRASRRGG